jgi:anti-sigma regulatory factor (Ser/Thr protein kinase)
VNNEPRRSQAARSTDAAVLDQAFHRDSLYALRSAVAAHASAAGLPRQRVYDVVTAAHEMASNAVRHGAGHGQLRLWADGRALHVQVSDDGPAKRDDTRPDAAEWNREQAHGLWIIDQLADQVSLDRDRAGTTVTVTFIISSPSGRPLRPKSGD